MNTVTCPDCGSKNKNTNIRCEKCGKQLIQEEQPIIIYPIIPETDHTENPETTSAITIFGGILVTIFGLLLSSLALPILLKTKGAITIVIGIPLLIFSIILLIKGIFLIIEGKLNKSKYVDSYKNGKIKTDKIKNFATNFEKIHKGFDNGLKKVGNIIYKSHVVIFLLIWFGIIIVYDINAIKTWSDGGNVEFYLSLIFWVAGIIIIVENIKNKK